MYANCRMFCCFSLRSHEPSEEDECSVFVKKGQSLSFFLATPFSSLEIPKNEMTMFTKHPFIFTFFNCVGLNQWRNEGQGRVAAPGRRSKRGRKLRLGILVFVHN